MGGPEPLDHSDARTSITFQTIQKDSDLRAERPGARIPWVSATNNPAPHCSL